jgi:hypothetical protein
MDVTLVYFESCPHWEEADRRLGDLATELGFTIGYRQVSTPEEAEALSFRGSPTILVDGHDPFVRGGEPVGLACRVYQTPHGPAGVPTVEQLRTALTGGQP